MNETTVLRQAGILELDKVLKELSEYASFEDSAARIQGLKPSFEMSRVLEDLAFTDAAYQLMARFGAPSFGGAGNVNNALSRAEVGGVLTFADFLNIANLLHVIRSVKEWYEHFAGSTENRLQDLFEALVPNRYFEDKVFSVFDSEETMNDNASKTLSDIRRKIRSSASSIREKLDKMIRSQHNQKFLQGAIVTQRDGRFVVPVKAEYRQEVPGLIHDTSGSGATLFIEPMAILEVNNELRVLRNCEADEIERILTEMSREAADFADNIRLSFDAVVLLDLYFCKAKYAFDLKAVVPKVNDRGRCLLKNARHPLLKNRAVPITVMLGKSFDTLIITGPNTGGKTVTLKTVGLLTLMALCGLMIPADDGSEINVYSGIFADIGDEQSIEQSLSTFSSHMTNIVSILKKPLRNSLVLLDELGAGTDPVEGAALARSIIEELHKKGAYVITTTHYAELKSYALDTDRVENACCEFDVVSLRPTYRLLIGVPGRSNAFAISEKLGISKEIIENAASMVSEEDKRFERVVASLQEATQTAEKERDEATRLRSELDRQKEYLKVQQEKIKAEREAVLNKAHETAADILERARNDSAVLLNQLEDMKKKLTGANAKETVMKAREAAKRSLNSLEKSAHFVDGVEENYELPRELMIGDTVELVDIKKRASVVTLPDKSGNLEVMAGIIKLRTNLKNLRLIEESVQLNGQSKPKQRKVSGLKSRAERTVESELDLRGMASDEALLELERFIDNALLSGIETVRIIHGKGTGVLRKAVAASLKHNKSVRTFRLGVFGEGEDGVTIAELK